MTVSSSASAQHEPAAVRVLVVDDSAVVRGLTKRWLDGAPGVVVAGVACDGEEGVEKADALKPDVVILDIEMPKLDGLSALPRILAAAPGAKVLMASTLTQRNADITLKALAKGATDFVPKPETGRIAAAAQYQRDLVEKVRALGGVRTPAPQLKLSAAHHVGRPGGYTLAAPSTATPRVLAIGSSTGGPQALRAVITAVGGKIDAPIFITQHMPPTFTAMLATHLDTMSPASAMEGRDGMPVRSGHIYLAPGDYHMTVVKRAGAPVIALDQRPAENFCRPAVDPMFRAIAKLYGRETLGVVLTGMGHDGAAGAKDIVEAGGSVIAQDEATSVVWGMPGAVAETGAACAIEPITKIGPKVVELFNRKRR